MSAKVGNREVVASSFLEATGAGTKHHTLLEKEGALSIFRVGVVISRHHFVHRVSDQVYVNWVLVAKICEISEVYVPVKRRGQCRFLPDFIYVLHNLLLKRHFQVKLEKQQNLYGRT